MIPLQDKCPISSIESIHSMIENDLNVKFSDIFEDFDTAPIGTASLAQVHKAHLKETGELVAVKVQHPTLQQFVPLDILMTRTVLLCLTTFSRVSTYMVKRRASVFYLRRT